MPTREYATSQTSSGSTAAVVDLSPIAVGSAMLAVFTTDSNGTGAIPAGWTNLLPVGLQQATGSRRTAIAGRIKQAGDSSLSWNSTASAYKRLTVASLSAAAPLSAWIIGVLGVRASADAVSGQSVQAGTSTTSVAPGVNVPEVDGIMVSVLVEISTAVGDPTLSGASLWYNSGDASPVIEQHTLAYTTPAVGTTGAVTATYVPTQASNGMGVQIFIPKAAATPPPVAPPGFSSVDQMLATPGATWAHRGGSTNWPEMSEYAYDQAALAGYSVLEFSAHRTSDGVWVGSHNPSLNFTSETTGLPNISAMTWAQVQTYMNSRNSAGTPRPYYRLDAFLDKFTPTHVCIVDPKEDVSRIAEFLAICDAHGGNTKIVVKFFGVGGGSTALADAANAKGYKTWGYFYEANIADGGLAADQSHWSILGMEYGASQASWNTILAYGKPVVGHIAASQANYDMAIAKGARMVQCANVAGIRAVGATKVIVQTMPALQSDATATATPPAFVGAIAETMPALISAATGSTGTAPAFTAAIAETMPALISAAAGTVTPPPVIPPGSLRFIEWDGTVERNLVAIEWDGTTSKVLTLIEQTSTP